MHRFVYLFLILSALFSCKRQSLTSDLITPFEASDSLKTCTYEEGINWWKALAESSPLVRVNTFGETDAGMPLHLIIVNTDSKFPELEIKESGKTIWLINNGIHPGEPDGIDASMLFVRDLVKRVEFEKQYKDVILMIIPFYNIGGALYRNCCSRTNQNGPVSYGFRGNAKNLDLNRDFIKMDSRNAQSFAQLIQTYNPDVYLETHVSNGADYPYTMTYLLSHPDKITTPLSKFMTGTIKTGIELGMSELDDAIVPYVNVHNTSPDSGYAAFYDSPRYSTGYLALHQCLALLTETHMLKPFSQRVSSTLRFLKVLGNVICDNAQEIKQSREEAFRYMLEQDSFILDWKIDYSRPNPLSFKGYQAYFDTSAVTNLPQLYYNEDSIWEGEIPYFSHLTPVITIKAPAFYLLPRSWSAVIDRLKWNRVKMTLLDRDTSIECSVYSIVDYETNNKPFEGHYFHFNTKVESVPKAIEIRKNKYFLVSTDQKARRFLIETLEPEGPDSYFNWNFYDEILQQKEWFSSYVFDKEAAEMLNNEEKAKDFKEFMSQNPSIENNTGAQLYYLYQQSAHFENDLFMIYPVFRIE